MLRPPYNISVGTLDNLVGRQMVRHQIDCLGLRTELPLTATYFPLGFRADFATNSRDVLNACDESWKHWEARYACEPLRLRVLVHPEGPLAAQPVHRMQGHLYSVIADPYNFAHVDAASQFAFVEVSQATASDHVWLRWFFTESLVY